MNAIFTFFAIRPRASDREDDTKLIFSVNIVSLHIAFQLPDAKSTKRTPRSIGEPTNHQEPTNNAKPQIPSTEGTVSVAQNQPPPVEPDHPLVAEAKTLLSQNSAAFELCSQGQGGTYFVKNNGQRFAVFKPLDEEPGAVNNPKQSTVSILPPGGGSIREVAACALDKGRANVPPTFMLEDIQHGTWKNSEGSFVPKTGSLQQFVDNASDVADLSSSLFSVEDVHNIGILDMRLYNLDRNGENILAVPIPGKKEFRLVPIDHAYSLPPNLSQRPFLEWQFWKQAKTPFSPETLAYIDSIDIESDARTLASLGLPSDSIRTMRISTLLLKKFAAAGANLYEIASMICDEDESGQSHLEPIVKSLEASLPSGESDSPQFYEQLGLLLDKVVVEKGKRGERKRAYTA